MSTRDQDQDRWLRDRFASQVARAPEAVAVIAGERRIRYRELDARANGVAHRLAAAGAGPGTLVGICVDRDESLLVALLGVLKAGAGYVPLDSTHPAARLRFMAGDAGLRLVLTAGPEGTAAAAGMSGVDLLAVDGTAPVDSPPAVRVGPADPAYVYFTSGSTGGPKGVVVEQRQVANLLDWSTRAFSAAELRGVLAATPACFDVSVVELFTPLVTGGALVLAPDLLALPELPARERVTMVFGVPSGLAALARFTLPAGVRTVVPAGEALSRALADRLYDQPGVTRVLNCFGPTECTVYCAAEEVGAGDRSEPAIGTPVAGAVFSVRDPATGAPAADGELWVAGPGVARGYLNRPGPTADRFVTDPAGVRWYRTGDRVSYDGDRYHFLGRYDDQVKVRGIRVEPGEVQAVLNGHPEVQHAVVLAPPDRDGTRRLVGYVQPAAPGLTVPALREWLAGRLPVVLVPSTLVLVDRLPFGPTGKIDREALPDPADQVEARAGAPAGPDPAPADPVEALVAEVMAETLEVPRVGAGDRFPDLGGHSLAAARVVATLAERLGREVPLGWFLAEPTAAGLARRLAATDGQPPAAGSGPVRHPDRRVYPLTDAQRELWLGRQLYPDSSTSIAVRLRLTPVDAARVRAVLDDLVVAHEVLRTRFEEWDDGPVAVVGPPAPVPVTEVDLTGAAAADRAARVEEVVAGAARHVFDLAGPEPLIRATLVVTAPGTAELLVVADHIGFDGYSVRLLMAGLAGGAAPEPPVQTGDIALYERALADDPDGFARLREFWRERLAGVAPPRRLGGGDGGRAARGARVAARLGPELDRAVDALAAATGGSRFAVYAAALAVLLHRLTGDPGVLVGTASAVRDRPGLDQVIGPLFRVLPVPVAAGGDPTFQELAARAATGAREAVAHQDLPTGELAGCAGFDRPPGEALCPVLLTVQPEEVPVVAGEGPVRVELVGEQETGMAIADLTFLVNPTGAGVEVQLEYDLGLYSRADAEMLRDGWLRLLRQGVSAPDRPVSRLALLAQAQREALLERGRGAPLPARRPDTVVTAIDEQARVRPEAVAVVGGDRSLTYPQLVAASVGVAAAVAAAGAGRGHRVGVCVPRDELLPAALLGVLRAGAGYVPLDVESPTERLAWLVADAGASVVVSRGAALAAARAVPGVTVVDLDRLPGAPPPAPPGPEDLAYVLYTSGSTGRPKGVEVSHASLADHTTALRSVPGIRPDDVVLAASPLTFDAVGIEIWSPLAAGAGCLVVERDPVVDAHALASRIAKAGPTVAFLPPTLARMLLAAGWPGDPALRVWCGGEALDPALARELASLVAEVWNVYGPTETTTLSTVHQWAPGTDARVVPIGRALPGEHVYVMDRYGRLLPPGTVGELWIGGTGVARGYRGRPGLTAATFVPDPYLPSGRCYRTGDLVRWRPDGPLVYLGRADHQVKLRGQRLELGEIEAVLHDHPDVTQAVVTVHGTGPEAILVGYLAPSKVDSEEVARFLRGRLPAFMVPDRWVTLPTIPTTASGKVDRRGLPAPARPDATEPPGSEVERFLAEVWAGALGVPVSRSSNFFGLGGNSYAATRVVARLREVLGNDLPVSVLFAHPVLADLAAELERRALAELADQ